MHSETASSTRADLLRVLLAGAALLLLVACDGDDQGSAGDPDDEEAQDPDVEVVETAEDERPPEGREAAPGPAANQPWTGPSDDEIGADVGFDPVLFDGQDAMVAVTGMTVYEQGADVRVSVRERPETVDEQAVGDGPLGIGPGPSSDAPDPDDPEVLELVVTYPDGQTASTAAEPHGQQDLAAAGEPGGPILISGMSQGTPGVWDYELWLWPLPEQGEDVLEITAEWPAEGIEGTQELDVDAITAASDRALQPWAD